MESLVGNVKIQWPGWWAKRAYMNHSTGSERETLPLIGTQPTLTAFKYRIHGFRIINQLLAALKLPLRGLVGSVQTWESRVKRVSERGSDLSNKNIKSSIWRADRLHGHNRKNLIRWSESIEWYLGYGHQRYLRAGGTKRSIYNSTAGERREEQWCLKIEGINH